LEYPVSDRGEGYEAHAVIPVTGTQALFSPKSSTEEIGIAVVGGGNFAQSVLLPAIQANSAVHLRGVVTQSSLRARDVANRFGFDYCSTNVEKVLADPHIDAVIIATRHDSHADFVLRALRAGKAVFVEKPLAINHKQLEEIAQFWYQSVATGSFLPCLMVGFNRRFAKASRLARRFLTNTPTPLVLTCRVNAAPLPREHWLHDPLQGGGRIIGEGCHFIDLLTFLACSFPKEIHAWSLPVKGGDRLENVVVQLRFANDSLGTLLYLSNGDKRVGKEYLEIFGGGATVIVDDFRRVTLSRGGHKQRIGHWWSTQDKGHRAEISAFVDAVRKGQPSPTPFEEVMRSSAATLSVVESLNSGLPVTLDEARFTRRANEQP